MSAAGTDLGELRSRRDALVAEIQRLAQARSDAEAQLLDAQRRRRLREAEGPDSAGAHVLGLVRDLVRALQDAQADRARAVRDGQEAALRLERMAARRRALESLLARIAQSLPDERSR